MQDDEGGQLEKRAEKGRVGTRHKPYLAYNGSNHRMAGTNEQPRSFPFRMKVNPLIAITSRKQSCFQMNKPYRSANRD
jgi:hypothetical protein